MNRNQTLSTALDQIMDSCDTTFRQRLAVRVALFLPRKRRELERAITELALTTGALPPEATDDGVYRGNWEDLLDWLWEHRNEILEFVMTIISLF